MSPPSVASPTVTNTQVTLIQIDNYGPWTVTPEPRREVDLQTLQSRLYADLCQQIGNREGYVFFTRFDNMIAVTNGIDLEGHARIQESIGNRYPVTLSLTTATGTTPADALRDATSQLQAAGSAQEAARREILRGRTIDPEFATDEDVQIAHFDVVDATGEYTDQVDAFSAFIDIERGYAELTRHLHAEYDSLSFFVGGDNFIAVCSGLEEAAFDETITHVEEAVDVSLRVGVARAKNAHGAGMSAKHALETCRGRGTPIEFAAPSHILHDSRE